MCIFFSVMGSGAGGVEGVLWTQCLCPLPLDLYAEALISRASVRDCICKQDFKGVTELR